MSRNPIVGWVAFAVFAALLAGLFALIALDVGRAVAHAIG